MPLVAGINAEVRRYDFQAGAKLRRNSSGGVIVSGLFARTGVQKYRNEDGTERLEYRDPSEVFAPETLDSLRGAPVIHGHVWVSPANKKALRIGTGLSAAKHSEQVDGNEWIAGEAVIDEPEAAATLGENPEVSVAYSHILDRSRTTAPDGTRVDGWQTQIRANHIGLGKTGWAVAGRAARIALDGNMVFEGQAPEGRKKMAEMITFDGVQVEKGSDTHLSLMSKVLASKDAKISEDGKALADLQTKVATQDGTIAGLQKKVTDTEAALAKATSPEAREDGIREETAFRTRMTGILGADVAFTEKRADGTFVAIPRGATLKKAIEKLVPGFTVRADGDASYLDAVLTGLEAAGGTRVDYSQNPASNPSKREDGAPPPANESLNDALWRVNSGK